MVESYFFIPATHPKLNEKLASIPADYLIIDLEDAIREEELDDALIRLRQISTLNHVYVRPPLFRSEIADLKLFAELLDIGFKNFIIPKFRNIGHLTQIENELTQQQIHKTDFVLVVENPESLFSLKDILQSTKLKVTALGFGSQDYCTETGMRHSRENLMQPRFLISGMAKSMGMKAIDIACMEVKEEQLILEEIQDAFVMGFEGKFLIHPYQLKMLNTFPFFGEKEIKDAREVLSLYEAKGKPAVFSFKGKAIEPPHIRNYMRIVKWADSHGK